MIVFFKLLSKLWFVLLLLLVAAVLFITVGQAEDVFFGLAYDDKPWTDFALLCLVLLLWGGSVWYSSRLLVKIAIRHLSAKKLKKKYIVNCINFIPRINGLIPFIIILLAIDYGECGHGVIQAVVIAILGSLFFVFIIFRRPLLGLKSETTNKLLKIRNLPLNERYSIYSITVTAILIILILMLLPRNTAIGFATWLGPLSVLILGLAIWTWAAAVITWLDSRTKWPVSFLLFVIIIVFSVSNDNDVIQIIKADTEHDQSSVRPSLEEHFAHWYQSSHRPWQHVKTVNRKEPIYIIAGEGGGSRASFWTSGMLSKLDSAIEEFQSRVFIMSTVSGSSVGAGIYNASSLKMSKMNPDTIHAIAGGDYLSPINLTLVSGEIIQGVIPIGIPKVDRAKYLEDAWSKQFALLHGDNNLDKSVLHLWEDDPYALPINVFNTVVAETGQKGYISPLKLELPDVLDVLEEVPYEIPLKTSMSLSARFPFFTSTGTIKDKETWTEPRLSLTDGGYYENTGIETAIDLYNRLNAMRTDSTYSNVSFIIIFIQNSQEDGYEDPQHLNFMDVVSLPLSTLLTTWSTESIPMKRNVMNYLSLVKADSNKLNDEDQLITLKLDHDDDDGIPLSRYISDSTKRLMIHKMNLILESKDVQDMKKNFATNQTTPK